MMNLLFIITYSFWFLSELGLNRLLRSKKTDRINTDKGSLSIIWITIMGSIAIAVVIAMNRTLPISSNLIIPYLGLALIIFGIIFRFIAIISLGRFFTVDVTIRKDHKLKKNGLYRYLRHPSYFAALLSFIGLGVSLNNWVSLLLLTIDITVVFIFRIKIEEKVLIEQFGSEYIEYKKSTSGLIPFIY